LLVLDAIVVARDFARGDALLLATVAAVALLVGRSRPHFIAALAVTIGLILGAWRDAPPQLDREIENVALRGIVDSDVTAEPWGDSFELLTADRNRYAVSTRDGVVIGENLLVSGRLEPFDGPRNPGEPSARAFARERGLTARLVSARVVARAPPSGIGLRAFAARIRFRATTILNRFLNGTDATILAGMLYGARGTLAPELRAEFQDTGTVHVLVTAGLHLGVIAALITFIFSRIGIGRIAASLATIPPVWCYAILSGAHVPSLRAATMVTVGLVARALGERALSLNTLALAAIVVAALWPAWVGGASFGLSFSCVGAIVLFAEAIARSLHRLRVPQPFREALALTLSTQLGVWPLTASTFLVIAPYAALANLFVVPVVGVAMLGGIALLGASQTPLAPLVARVESWPLAWIEGVVHLTSRLPFAHIIATPPPMWTLAAYDLGMIAVAFLARYDDRRKHDGDDVFENRGRECADARNCSRSRGMPAIRPG
jgi:ComEC/Rec2-related protein